MWGSMLVARIAVVFFWKECMHLLENKYIGKKILKSSDKFWFGKPKVSPAQ